MSDETAMTEQISPEALYAAAEEIRYDDTSDSKDYTEPWDELVEKGWHEPYLDLAQRVLSAALPHLRDQIERQLREQIADYGDRCGEEVSRRGEAQPCDKTAVAARYDPREEFAGEPPYAVCAYHARGRMVPLSELLRGQ